MATTRSVSPVSAVSPAPSAAPLNAPARHRLRAVDRDEVVDVADFLPPGATWLPAPQHTLPVLPGRPPMVGYLVLVPADQQPPFLPVAVPEQAGPAVQTGPAAKAAASGQAAGEPLVRIDSGRRTAFIEGRELDLTYLEFELLAHLVAHPHRVHTRDQLVTTVWGYGHVGDGRTVDVHVARLRRKLGAEHRRTIQTVRRVGYKYIPPTGR
ncbi:MULTISPECIES: winged helix-turn-helix domain-containing protein [unclassified Streptomyces]|uniref:winged helix-turn-helix domain-containing protein n=1 Tax=unclassified Streptomyces TaxID=2593676 RepID=UPI00136E6641|nr:winged helix family transcriptional regulator [Streptomyces sp. SID6139]MYR17373.1 winged helix family transcriptional regulator [Streptomyces sp. SID6137]MYR23185.1 winged helix family transcriptional regulator [Streptomyces sp. SID6137]